MFCFGSETDGVFTLVQNEKGYVYTWPDEKTAREFFEVAQCEAHLYQVMMDLSVGWLIERGDYPVGSPAEVFPNEEQKRALFDSYVYKSLLEWAPLEQTIEVPE